MVGTSITAVSAPGKVLLAGGYLVLDRDFTGLVFGLDARIHVCIEKLKTTNGVDLQEIIVKSPQFVGAVWEYGYRSTENNGGVEVTQLRVSSQDKLLRNPFVETTLSYALTYISTLTTGAISPASITILADNSYYTTDSTLKDQSNNQKFSSFGVKLSEAHKTGLGSSAALVSSLTGALLLHYLPSDKFSLDNDLGKSRLHNLAQAAHCAAQGKVGSGFDVASAVYGSCLYRRFSPSLLQNHGSPGSSNFAKDLKSLIEETTASHKWDTEILKDAVKVPSGIRLIMCDVDCGSQTPGMVKKVLEWRKREPDEAEMLWSQLHSKNEALAAELKRLAEEAENTDYTKLKQAITDIRILIRDMSRLSDVPIEPTPQMALLDACSEIGGVIGGVVPGAGGYDAIALLVEDKKSVISNVQKLISTWKVEAYKDGEGGPSIGKVSLLAVREEMEGIRVENVQDASYEKWIV
ncbi:ERG8, Phosphomevalonate kinase [Tothia fuscella]|uniref:Phosphomevalonate kinase n=1 Tax=Tothia fuscella TaxID=1048955 RepID=A0A9P4U1I8_9PEZI|nr:ERG8, Phosphomevalonate kinase [Tothia fuscella]